MIKTFLGSSLLIGLGLAGLIYPTSANAYSVVNHDIVLPDTTLPITFASTTDQYITGELAGYPELIEFNLTTEESFTITLLTLPNEEPRDWSGVLVKVSEQGVDEVDQFSTSGTSWSLSKDPVSKLTFLTGPRLTATLEPGQYRFEIGNQTNTGKYILQIGDQDSDGSYANTWSAVTDLYSFVEVNKLWMVVTPLVYYPLGIVLLLIGFGLTIYSTRKQLPFWPQKK